MQCQTKKLFNPEADDSKRKIFCGETTNLLDLSSVKYPEFITMVDTIMYPNNWLPQKVSNMEQDKHQYKRDLTEDEREAYNNIISFLTFLDSVQTNNLPNIAEYITLPEIVYFLTRQAYEEAIHSRSYAYIGINVMTTEEFHEIVYKWKTNPVLLKRNEYIASVYDECKIHRDVDHFILDLNANLALEGLYFYNGFQFFHNLANRNLMIATDVQIKYIQRDEQVHCKGFETIIKRFLEEEPQYRKRFEEIAYPFWEKAVKMEIEFSQSIIGDKILGMSSQSIEDYAYYLANRRLKGIGLNEIFPKKKNPYKHLERIAAIEDESSNRANQFETTSITYKSPEILDGWDEI